MRRRKRTAGRAPSRKVRLPRSTVSLPPSHVPNINIDEDYISFLESLKEVSTKPFDADTLETLSAFTLSRLYIP